MSTHNKCFCAEIRKKKQPHCILFSNCCEKHLNWSYEQSIILIEDFFFFAIFFFHQNIS